MENMEKFLETVETKVKSTISDELKSKNEKIETLEKSIKDLQSKSNNSKVAEAITNIELEVKSLKEKAGTPVSKPFTVKSMLIENKESLVGMAEKSNGNLVLKAPATMLVSSNIVGANAGLLPEVEYRAGMISIAERSPSMLDNVNSFRTDSAQISWADEINPEGDAEFIAEGSLKPLADFEITPKLSQAKEVAVVMKVGKNMLKDIPWLESTINGKMRDRIILKTDEKLFSGDETGSGGVEFDGIDKYASSFVAGSLAGTVPTPTTADAIRSSIAQITVQTDTDRRFSPNFAYMNPYDVAGMDLQKGSDGHYTLPPFVSAEGRTVYGVKVVESTLIPAGQLLVGDFSKSNFGVYEDIEIDFGYENDDFRKNLITMRASARYHHYISGNEAVAFVYDSIATIKTAIEKV